MLRVGSIKDNDWQSLRQAFQKLASINLGHTSTPRFAGLTLTELTASRLIWTDASKALASKDLVDLVDGTANQVTVTDDGDGTITLSLPQDIATTSSPTFDDLTVSTPSNIYNLSHDSFADFVSNEHIDWTSTSENLVTTGTVNCSGGKVRVEDGATSAPSGESDGYVGVAKIGADGRIYFAVEGSMYYIDGTVVEAAEIVTGNPIGLLLALTYNLE